MIHVDIKAAKHLLVSLTQLLDKVYRIPIDNCLRQQFGRIVIHQLRDAKIYIFQSLNEFLDFELLRYRSKHLIQTRFSFHDVSTFQQWSYRC